MHTMRCSGWWEQHGYGRQTMQDLRLTFADGQLSGRGTDIIGDFVFRGHLQGERVYLLKQYLGKHQIEYHGTYDGEGVYFGRWGCGGYLGGKWLIRVERAVGLEGTQAEILEI